MGLLMCGISFPILIYALVSWENFYYSLRYDEHWWGSDAGTVTDEGEFPVYGALIMMIIFAIAGITIIIVTYRDVKSDKKHHERLKKSKYSKNKTNLEHEGELKNCPHCKKKIPKVRQQCPYCHIWIW